MEIGAWSCPNPRRSLKGFSLGPNYRPVTHLPLTFRKKRATANLVEKERRPHFPSSVGKNTGWRKLCSLGWGIVDLCGLLFLLLIKGWAFDHSRSLKHRFLFLLPETSMVWPRVKDISFLRFSPFMSLSWWLSGRERCDGMLGSRETTGYHSMATRNSVLNHEILRVLSIKK